MGSRPLCALLGAALVAGPGPALAAEDCSSAGTRAFRTEGIDAAFAAFAEARQRPECEDDAQLAFNYARSLQSLLDRDGDDARACDGAGAYAQAATADTLPGAVRALAAKGRAELAGRCDAARASAAPTADYETLVTRARSRVRDGDKAGAAEAWKAASRLKPDAALPHRALCSLLPDLDRADEGRGHCRQWRALEPAMATTAPVEQAPDRTMTWVITGGAVAALVAGSALYGVALGAAEDASDARHEAGVATDPVSYHRAEVAFDDARERTGRAQAAAFVLLGVGAALGGWAGWRWISEDGPVAVRPLGPGLELHGRF